MCPKLKYFVLALFLDAVASSPYNIPRYNGNYNPEAASHPINEFDVQRNEETDIPRSLPSYMSPIPTALDSKINEEILRQSSNLRDPRSLHYNANKREFSRLNEQHPSVAQSTRSYANPSSTLNGNEVLSHLLRFNRPIVKRVVELNPPVNGREMQKRIYDENLRPEALSQPRNNNYEPPIIQVAAEKRIAFQPPVLPNVPNLGTYHPATPVRNFNIDREWSNIAKEQPKLPDFIAERIRQPVDFQRSQLNNQQVHKPFNAELPGSRQQYNLHKIILNERIQNVLSSTKKTKRYLVIHPNGTIEHVDSLAPIIAGHPNYVLVNAGHVVAANNPKTDKNTYEGNVQVPVPTLEPITSSKEPVVPYLFLPEPLIKNNQAVVNIQTLSPKTSTIEEAAPSSESPIAPKPRVVSSSTTANISSPTPLVAESTLDTEKVTQELDVTENNLENEDVSEIKNFTSLKLGAENSKGVEEMNEDTANVVKNTSVTRLLTPISIKSVEENGTPESIPIPATEAENITVDADVLENIAEIENNFIAHSTQNIDNSEDAETDNIKELDSLEGRPAGKPKVYYTSDPDFWNKVTDGKKSNFIYFFQVKSSPRVEMDRQRTIYPDGTILEELTETVWDGEGGDPRVMKSSKFIHPDDL